MAADGPPGSAPLQAVGGHAAAPTHHPTALWGGSGFLNSPPPSSCPAGVPTTSTGSPSRPVGPPGLDFGVGFPFFRSLFPVGVGVCVYGAF